MGAPQRGVVHSVFNAAANIVFPGNFILSLNAALSPHLADQSALGGIGAINRPLLDSETVGAMNWPLRDPENNRSTPRMPNGLQLTARAGTFPFTALRAGMPVIFGAQRLHIEAISCSLDLSLCSEWDPHIERPEVLDMKMLRKNRERLAGYVNQGEYGEREDLRGDCCQAGADFQGDRKGRPYYTRSARNQTCIVGAGLAPALVTCNLSHHLPHFSSIRQMAQSLCGRGPGLTPSGDDMLAGWMAAGWLLYGPQPGFLAACQQIVEVAGRQTHLLSQCWLAYAAEGNVAQPIRVLLEALICDDAEQLNVATEAVLTMGATSGHDVIQGILLMLNEM